MGAGRLELKLGDPLKALRTVRRGGVFLGYRLPGIVELFGSAQPWRVCKTFAAEFCLVSLVAHWRVLIFPLCLFMLQGEASGLMILPSTIEIILVPKEAPAPA